MLLTTESTIRCRCGRELSALREIMGEKRNSLRSVAKAAATDQPNQE
jgi:hypothetical protein